MSHDLICIYVSETDYNDYTFMLVFYLVLWILSITCLWTPESRSPGPLVSGIKVSETLGLRIQGSGILRIRGGTPGNL